jgi:hypothetical protein
MHTKISSHDVLTIPHWKPDQLLTPHHSLPAGSGGHVLSILLDKLDNDLVDLLAHLRQNQIKGAFRNISLVNGDWQTDFGGNDRRMVALTPERKKNLKAR